MFEITVPSAKGFSRILVRKKKEKQRFPGRDSSTREREKEGKRARGGEKKRARKTPSLVEETVAGIAEVSQSVPFEFQIKSKCARVVRVCIHVPSSA